MFVIHLIPYIPERQIVHNRSPETTKVFTFLGKRERGGRLSAAFNFFRISCLVHASDLVFMRVSLAELSRKEIRICLYSRALLGQQSVLRALLATIKNGLSRLTKKHYRF